MQYYTFNINDYTGGTAHLDPIEDIAYRRLIDLYYQTEAPITADMAALAKRLRLREYTVEIQAVLDEFFWFDAENQVWRNERCERELTELYAKSEKARQSAAARWGKQGKKSEAAKPAKTAEPISEQVEMPEDKGFDANAMRTHNERNANAMLPNTQYPLTTINQSSARDADFADDGISDGLNAADGVFAMYPAWQPADTNALALLLRNARLPAMGTELFAERLAEFVSHWLGEPDEMRTEAQWVHTLVQSLLWSKNRGLLNPVPPPAVVAESGGAVAPAAAAPKGQSATAKSRDCLKVAKAAALGGQAQTATPAPVFAALADGLLDCLGHGLAFPPAADSWDLVLKTWDAEFSKLRLPPDAESVQRVQTAFAATLKAVLKSEARAFPKADDVIRNLPMRLVPKAIEQKRTPQEKAASEQARAAALANGEGLGKILGSKAKQADAAAVNAN